MREHWSISNTSRLLKLESCCILFIEEYDSEKICKFDVFNEIIINVNLPDDIALNPYRKQNHFGFHAGKQTNHFLGLLQCEKKFTSSGKSIEVV